jgi:hypothetical protein
LALEAKTGGLMTLLVSGKNNQAYILFGWAVSIEAMANCCGGFHGKFTYFFLMRLVRDSVSADASWGHIHVKQRAKLTRNPG